MTTSHPGAIMSSSPYSRLFCTWLKGGLPCERSQWVNPALVASVTCLMKSTVRRVDNTTEEFWSFRIGIAGRVSTITCADDDLERTTLLRDRLLEMMNQAQTPFFMANQTMTTSEVAQLATLQAAVDGLYKEMSCDPASITLSALVANVGGLVASNRHWKQMCEQMQNRGGPGSGRGVNWEGVQQTIDGLRAEALDYRNRYQLLLNESNLGIAGHEGALIRRAREIHMEKTATTWVEAAHAALVEQGYKADDVKEWKVRNRDLVNENEMLKGQLGRLESNAQTQEALIQQGARDVNIAIDIAVAPVEQLRTAHGTRSDLIKSVCDLRKSYTGAYYENAKLRKHQDTLVSQAQSQAHSLKVQQEAITEQTLKINGLQTVLGGVRSDLISHTRQEEQLREALDSLRSEVMNKGLREAHTEMVKIRDILANSPLPVGYRATHEEVQWLADEVRRLKAKKAEKRPQVGEYWRARNGSVFGPLEKALHGEYVLTAPEGRDGCRYTWAANGCFNVDNGDNLLDLLQHVVAVPNGGWEAVV